MSQQRPERSVAKAIFGVMALASVLLGLALYLLQTRIGIPEDTARLLSTGFIVLGIADTVVLLLWNRLFERGS